MTAEGFTHVAPAAAAAAAAVTTAAVTAAAATPVRLHRHSASGAEQERLDL